jgi:hypothetical protein
MLGQDPSCSLGNVTQEKSGLKETRKLYTKHKIKLKRASESQSQIKGERQNMKKGLKGHKKQSVFRLNSHGDLTITQGLKDSKQWDYTAKVKSPIRIPKLTKPTYKHSNMPSIDQKLSPSKCFLGV